MPYLQQQQLRVFSWLEKPFMQISTEKTLTQYRQEFVAASGRALSMPLAGALVWASLGIASLWLDQQWAIFAMLYATGAIFPLALLIAKLRGEAIMLKNNPLSQLMGISVLMVNLLWALHIPLVIYAPEFVTLSLGIGLGLHWCIYSWIIQHPLGVVHAVLRTLLVVAAWFALPEQRVFAEAMAVTLAYALSIYQMHTRNPHEKCPSVRA
jgi:hypothetical protein